jgi:hypothetical protein
MRGRDRLVFNSVPPAKNSQIAMRSRWYRSAVLILWGVATIWLVAKKILPPLLVGEPPVYASTATEKSRPPVAWYLNLNDNRLGWALSEISRQATDVTEIHSLVHFDGLPIDLVFPSAIRPFVRASTQLGNSNGIDVESHMLINPLNQLQSFDSKVKQCPHTGQSLVAIEGNVDGDTLTLAYRYGDTPQKKLSLALPENKIRDSLSPETELRGLHVGQSWTIVSYSPLSSNPLDYFQQSAPTEVLLAKVEDKTDMMWNGQSEPVWLVVYRSDTAQDPASEKNVRNRMWVRMDGTVIREEVRLSGIRLLFVRMPDKDAAKLRTERKEFFTRSGVD